MKKEFSAGRTALLGILAALAVTLSFVETLLPPLPFLPPGFKIGLSNIAVMYGLLVGGIFYGAVLCALKSVFVLIVSGGYAFMLSLLGGVCAILVMWALIILFKEKISYASISVAGALSHNLVQLCVVAAITASASIFYYAPVLIIAAVVCGFATAAIVRCAMPLILKIK